MGLGAAGLLPGRVQARPRKRIPPLPGTRLPTLRGQEDAFLLREEGLGPFSPEPEVERPRLSKQALVPHLQMNARVPTAQATVSGLAATGRES